jgi:hypothetical protein
VMATEGVEGCEGRLLPSAEMEDEDEDEER